MNKEFWEIWLEDKNEQNIDFKKYIKSKKIKIEKEAAELIQGHLIKAEHNLKFVKLALDTKEFNDWAIVSAYYAIYHASLSLCALKGYTTKDHSATLLILIKEFYKKELTKEEIETIGKITLEKEKVLYYIEARAKRIKASYSTQRFFDNVEADGLRSKAISFINKVKEILDFHEQG